MDYFYLIDSKNRGDLVEQVLKKRKGWKPIKYDTKHWTGFYNAMKEYKWNFIWKPTVNDIYDKKLFNNGNLLTNFPLLKIINHFPNPDVITRKPNLLRTLKKYSTFYMSYLPETYIYPENTNILNINDTSNIWIVKPEYRHSGQGIQLFDDMKKVKNFFETNTVITDKDKEYVIQKYIKNPYLYNGRKFDIRINVLVRDNEIYVCPYGFVRTISAPYVPYLTENEKENMLIHITNHSVQKLSKNYSKYEEGNVMSVDNIFEYIIKNTGNKNIRNDLLIEWSKIIMDVIYSGMKEGMNDFSKFFSEESSRIFIKDSAENIQNFEMFGFDLMLDENLHTWLLEVNTNPGLEQNNRWAAKIVNNMLEELIQICVDKNIINKKYWIKIT